MTVESTLVQIVKAIVIFAFILQVVPLILLLERKLLGRFQARYGPNRVGFRGLGQPRERCAHAAQRRPEGAVGAAHAAGLRSALDLDDVVCQLVAHVLVRPPGRSR